jgi:hypothetical protein
MAAKYKKIDPRMWDDEKFRSLTNEEKLIAIYIITAQSNRIGLFVFSVGQALEDLGMVPETFLEGFGKVCQRLKWVWNSASRTVYLPTWWKYNPPEGPNIIKGCLNDLHDLPQTPLLAMFCENENYLFGSVRQTFREGIRKAYPLLRHEHEHEHNLNTPPNPQRGKEKKHQHDKPKRRRVHETADELLKKHGTKTHEEKAHDRS